jgi:2-haloacid dehalogenase
MMAKGRGIALSADQKSGILHGMLRLPAHPDVEGALQMLRDAGLRLVTLTNSAPAAVQQQLTNSGLSRYFEQAFSVDAVRRFKPAPEVYASVADALAIPVGELRLVAAHAWDIWGALRAGYAAAFVSRPGKALCPLAPKPDIVGRDLLDVARQIVAVETR